MPRGKNYVNQNKGMRLQAPSKSSVQKQECKYGSACNRKDCIYRHTASKEKQSNDPCMAYLAGICTFTGRTCRKRHPSDEECEVLLKKYALRPCRFGEQCRTEGCLYNHDPKPVVHRAQIPTQHQRPVMPGTGPALSSWMPTNTLPSAMNRHPGSSAPHQLRPGAGAWKPSIVGSHVSAGTFSSRPPPPSTPHYPGVPSPYAYGHAPPTTSDPYGQTTSASQGPSMYPGQHHGSMMTYGQPTNPQQSVAPYYPVGANPNSNTWEPMQSKPDNSQPTEPFMEHSHHAAHNRPTSDIRDAEHHPSLEE